jgi:hypothetical protein
MKKYLWLLAAIFTVLALVTSCGGDDSTVNRSLKEKVTIPIEGSDGGNKFIKAENLEKYKNDDCEVYLYFKKDNSVKDNQGFGQMGPDWSDAAVLTTIELKIPEDTGAAESFVLGSYTIKEVLDCKGTNDAHWTYNNIVFNLWQDGGFAVDKGEIWVYETK